MCLMIPVGHVVLWRDSSSQQRPSAAQQASWHSSFPFPLDTVLSLTLASETCHSLSMSHLTAA